MTTQATLETPEKSLQPVVGAALVLGGGIAGVQSAIDLADQGYYVYLVEKGPAIGGTMAMLDKTFPTNDCSMCILSPKLVEAERHLNIELITLADVESLEGEPGRFRARIKKRPRSVDPDKCVGCGACIEACVVQNQIHLPHEGEIEVCLPEEESDAAALDEIMARHNHEEKNLLAILLEVNERAGYLPEGHMNYVAMRMGVPVSQVFNVATFYSEFRLVPRGRHAVKVCMGTSCHVLGAPYILDEVCEHLGIGPGQVTSDGRFSIDVVHCLGLCAFGPAMVIDERHVQVRRGETAKAIDSLLNRE